ncbi:MAG TPA: hypothetical protein VKT71_00615 [Candidatus Acidoferrales bacterium]|nr:hypothetical protein [Candidatus Acidoferrales bacterium]
MPRFFFQSTAEDLIASVEAVVVNGKPTPVEFVAQFIDVPRDRAENALKLAVDLEFLSVNAAEEFSGSGPLSQMFVAPNAAPKIAALRVALENYQPFLVFRARLNATDFAGEAARQTKVALDLNGHRDIIKDTLISLGTYSHALDTEGGGLFVPADEPIENRLLALAQACGDAASAEARIRVQIGEAAANIVVRNEVLLPLANALLRAAAGDGRGAVLLAGNAVESYLEALAIRLRGVNLAGAAGLNAKLERFMAANALPRKLIQVGKYLGNIRNAADHGVGDPDVNGPWAIQESTGTEFVYVACSFISAVTAREQGHPPRI